MKKLLNMLLIFFIFACLSAGLYVCIAFSELTMNYAIWNAGDRSIFAVLLFVFFGCYLFSSLYYHFHN